MNFINDRNNNHNYINCRNDINGMTMNNNINVNHNNNTTNQ